MKITTSKIIRLIVIGIIALPCFGISLLNNNTDNYAPVCACDPVAERSELLKFYNNFNGPNWINKWDTTRPINTWYGIFTSSEGCVISIYLYDDRFIKGKLYDFNFPNLKKLTLFGSDFSESDSIPDFKNLPLLDSLNLRDCKLKCKVPNFKYLPNLTFLYLSNNFLEDTIPDFSNFPKIDTLNLNNNNLVGKIPNFKNLPTLTYLNLSENDLTGSIPDFSGLPNLSYLALSNNYITGSIPDFSSMYKLRELHLDINLLSDSIPNFSFLPHLDLINLARNQLTGIIPGFTNSMKLQTAIFTSNLLSGISPDLPDLCLKRFEIDSNFILGKFPEELTKLQDLDSGRVDFKNNPKADSALSDKFIFFCPFGEDIFLNNKCQTRFKNICGNICNGDEWDNLSNHKWIQDTLNSLDCNQNHCLKTSIEAGFVDVRRIKLVFIRTRCYKNFDLTDSEEIVKFYDCGGNLIETVLCMDNQTCASYGAIHVDTFRTLNYDVRWNCSKEKSQDDSFWASLNCRPNPARSFSICKLLEYDTPNTVTIYDLNKKSLNTSYTIKSSEEIILDTKYLNPGIYIVIIKGKLFTYRTKIAIF